MPLLHKKPFRLEPLPSDLKPNEEVFVCHATKEVFRDYEKYFNRHFLCNSLVWTCELTGQANLTYSQAMQSEREARKVMDSLPECFQKAALSLVHHVRRTNVKTLADEVCAFYRLRFVEGEELGMRKKTASGAEVITPVRVVKVIPPSEHSPRSRSRSPLKSASPNSPTKLQPLSLLAKSKHTSPPDLCPILNSVVGAMSPTRIMSPSKSILSPPPQVSSPMKINSNSHVTIVTISSPPHPQSPLKSPHKLPVISKVAKSPPPLLPLNHIKDSASLHHSEDPLTTLTKSASSGEHVSPPQQNGLPESSHKSNMGENSVAAASGGTGSKGSDGKFRTPKTPSAPLTPEINLDPNDYRYMVEDISSPENKMVVKPSQITRGRGVLTPKKVKIFLRNALHRVSEKHPFTVKDEYVKKFGLGISTIDLTSLPSPSSTRSSRKRSYSQASLEPFMTPASSSATNASSSGSSPTKKARPTSLETSSRRRRKSAGSLSSGRKPRKSPKTTKTPSGRGSKSTKKSTTAAAKSPKRRKSTSKTPKSPKAPMIFPKMSGGSPEKAVQSLPMKTPKSPKSPRTPRSKLEALKVLNKAKKFKQMDLKKNLVVQEKRTLTEEELAIMRRLQEEERQRKIALREAEKLKRKEERLKKLRELQEQRRLEKLRQKELMKPREDLLCDNSKPLPEPTPVKSVLSHDQFGSAVMVLEFLNTFGPLFNVKEAIRGGITIDKIEYALAYEETDSLLYDIIKFLLQAIFATMEEEHESIVDIKKLNSKKDSPSTSPLQSEPIIEIPKEAATSSTTSAAEVNKSEGKSSPDASEEDKTIAAAKDEDQKMENSELADHMESALNGDEHEEGESQPLSVQMKSIISSASHYSKWSRRTQSVDLDKLVLDPYTCTEVLRLHLLSSGGYADSGDRSWFRHARRGGYLDADDPAVALRLKHPDIISSLARSSVYSLSAADKLELLSTLCSQLLCYSISREFIDEAFARAKKARRQIREIQFTEERRKREEKAAIIKEKKEEKARLKKQQESEKKPGDSSDAGVSSEKAEAPKPSETGSSAVESKVESEAKSQSSSVAPQPASTQDPVSNAPKETEKEGSSNQPPSKDKDEANKKEEEAKNDEERKAKMEQEIFELSEQFTEAISAVNLKPLGVDRYHRKYWVFPNLPGLFVEDSGDFSPPSPLAAEKVEGQSQKETVDVMLHVPKKVEKCLSLSPGVIMVQSQPNPSFQAPSTSSEPSQGGMVIDLTKDTPTELTPVIPKPPPLIPISQTASIVQEQEKRLSINNSSMVSTASSINNGSMVSMASSINNSSMVSSMSTPGGKSDIDTNLMQELTNIRASGLPRWSFYQSQDEIDSLLDSLNPRGIREVELKRIIAEQRAHFEPSLSKCPFQSSEELPSSRLPQPRYISANEYLELYLREQILDIEEKIHLGSLGYLREVEERAWWRDTIENSGAAAALDPNAPSHEEQAEKNIEPGLDVPKAGQGRSRSTTPFLNEDGSRRKTSPPVNPSVQELSKALLQVQAGIEKKYLMPPLGVAVDQKKRQRQKEKKIVKESDVCVEEWRASLAKATSFSQIFVHLATLERCVMWSKSLMNVRCRICRRKCGDEFMLLCDGCDHGYHTYCLKPPLKYVPEGDWFCYDCNPVTPVKPRRRAQRVVIVEEESSESEQEEEVQESEDEEEGSDQDEADDENEEESEEEEVVTSRRFLRSAQTQGPEVAVSSRKSTRGKALAQPNAKKRGKATKGKGKLGKEQLTKAKKPEIGTKRPRGRPPSVSQGPGRARGRPPNSAPQSPHSAPETSGSRGRSSTRKRLKMDRLPSFPVHQSKAESVIASIIELRCSSSNNGGRSHQSKREHKALENQLCEALWEDVNEQDNSVHFEMPVKKREYPDYHDVIETPMDLRTIKNKIKCHNYNNLDEFLQDMLLIFDNCLQYHKRHSKIGKAGASLKKYFEKRCADLGLKDLSLCSPIVNIGAENLSQSTRRVSSRNRK